MKTKVKKPLEIALIHLSDNGDPSRDNTLQRFYEELKNAGHRPEIISYYQTSLTFKNNKTEFYYQEKIWDIKKYSLVIPIMAFCGNVIYDHALLLEALEVEGLKMKNNLAAIITAKDKAKTALRLANAKIPHIPTAINFSPYWLKNILNISDNNEYVSKIRHGSLGKSVACHKSKISLISSLELMALNFAPASRFIFQPLIKEAKGKDIRVIATKDKVIAVMERRSRNGEFRSNLGGGGTGKAIKVDSATEKIAMKAIKALNLDYGGVDILMSRQGPLVIEVNANPQLKIEEITGVNVAGGIIKELLSA